MFIGFRFIFILTKLVHMYLGLYVSVLRFSLGVLWILLYLVGMGIRDKGTCEVGSCSFLFYFLKLKF
jgi:hypothetical protein